MKTELILGDKQVHLKENETLLQCSLKKGDQERYVNLVIDGDVEDLKKSFDLAFYELQTISNL